MRFFTRHVFPATAAPSPTIRSPLPADGLLLDSAPLYTRPWKVWQAGLFVSVWLALMGNIALWKAIAQLPNLGRGQQGLLGLSLAAIITCVCWGIVNLLGWGRGAKPLMVLLCWIAGFAGYFMLNYGIAIDSSMLVNVLQTDAHEAADLLHWTMAATVGAIAIPPTWWLWRQTLLPNTAWRPWLGQLGMVLAAVAVLLLVVLASFAPLSSAMRNHTQLRFMMNPLSSLYAAGNLVAQQLHHRDSHLYPIAQDVKLGASYAGQSQYPIYVLVVGETGRAGNFGLYGYPRATTPQLSARQDLAVALDAWSCGTSTAVSVPCMFSHLGRSGQNSGKSYENLLDVLQHAGLAVLWVDNQSGCKGVCERVHTGSTLPASNPAKADADRAIALSPQAQASLCEEGECRDLALLEGLDDRLNALPVEQRTRGVVLVLHQMGSHGPAYFKRSSPDDKRFGPECTNVALQSCDREAVVNAYDNSIIATDRMLAGLMTWLEQKSQRQPTAMMYVADHGESLGENNIYLHGLPYSVAPDVQKHVPWITWLSPLMQQRMGVSTACLQQSVAHRKISHDHYFHSVLGLTDVQTSVHDANLDIFAACAHSLPHNSLSKREHSNAQTDLPAAAPAAVLAAAPATPQSATSPKPPARAQNPGARKRA